MLSILLAMLLQSALPASDAAPPPGPAPHAPLPKLTWPTKQGDYIVKSFRFRSGETLANLRLHYMTLGQPHRNAAGEIDNAVMILHGTGGTGGQFLSSSFANLLYGPGQPLDITKYWIILPDNVGHGGSSKPSDGLHMKFPKYDYDDMVELQHILLTEHLGLKHLRLVMGTSMGCMHGFIWGEMYPDFPKAIMPLACMPIELAGLNRQWRQLMIDGIEADPAWMGGEYKTEPLLGIRTASSISFIAGSAPLSAQVRFPTRDAAIAAVRKGVERDIASRDANDMIYQFESSRNYNPWPNLAKITAPMMWINSADDFINPRNFPYPAWAIAKMPKAKFRLVPESTLTHGHGTHTSAEFWINDLKDLLARSGG